MIIFAPPEMLDYNPYKPNAILGLLLGAWLVTSSLWAVIAPLSGSEAYVWFSAGNLDWGTIDGSVLSQFFAWLGTAVCGDNEIGVRLFFLIAQPLAIYLFYDLVREPNDTTGRDIPLYLLLFLSMPIVQLNAPMAVDWAALMLAVSFVLWAYNRYIGDQTIVNALILGASFALVSWSDYRGILVLISILACNLRLFIDWKFWVAVGCCALLAAPSLWWQFERGWPMINFHVELYDRLMLSDTASDLGSMFLRFNPLLLVPFVVLIAVRKGSSEIMPRTMRMMFWLFAVAVVWGAFVGMSLGVMAGPILFAVVYVLMRVARQNPGVRRYLLFVTVFSAVFLFGVRSTALIKDYDSPTRADSVVRSVADTLRARGVEMIVTAGDKKSASLLNFYGSLPAWAMPTTRSGTNQYAASDMTERFAGHLVAVGLDMSQVGQDSILSSSCVLDMPDGRIYFHEVASYRPQNRLRIVPAVLPDKILTGSLMAVTLTMSNPYPYEIPMGRGAGKCKLMIQLCSQTTGRIIDVDLPFKVLFLPARSETVIASTARIPVVPTGSYVLGFTLREDPLPSIFYSPTYKLYIVNPKSRI